MAAASGIVAAHGRLWVAVDDELAIASFAMDGSGGRWHVLDGETELPLEPQPRKHAKPDLEAIAVLPEGDLLALGSGSTDTRDRAWRLNPEGGARELSLGPLYAALRAEFSELNIEGAAWWGGTLWLAQRGNGPGARNALIQVGRDWRPQRVVDVQLPELGGVGLALSDIHAKPDGQLAFAASAEASGSTFHDGAVTGSALGHVDPATGELEIVRELPGDLKLEGLAHVGGRWLLVTDADDAERPASLYALT